MADKIRVRQVDKIYDRGTVKALSNIDLTISEGEFVCLVGPSGCGKSTLLRIIAGLQRPSAGAVEIHSSSARVRPTAMVFQEYSIFPWMTVAANIDFGLATSGLTTTARRERVTYWIERMGLEQFASSLPSVLSGGMKQRVSIARAMAAEPEVLLMDEPFAALDAQLRRVMQEELLALWQEDSRTIVFVTHSIDEAILLGDRVVTLSSRPGRIVAENHIPFERPRHPEIRASLQFAELQQTIWEQLREQMLAVSATGAGR